MKEVGFAGILTVTHQGAACNAASVHFVPTIRRTHTHTHTHDFAHCTPHFTPGNSSVNSSYYSDHFLIASQDRKVPAVIRVTSTVSVTAVNCTVILKYILHLHHVNEHSFYYYDYYYSFAESSRLSWPRHERRGLANC